MWGDVGADRRGEKVDDMASWCKCLYASTEFLDLRYQLSLFKKASLGLAHTAGIVR